jgi:hypothetical protein
MGGQIGTTKNAFVHHKKVDRWMGCVCIHPICPPWWMSRFLEFKDWRKNEQEES